MAGRSSVVFFPSQSVVKEAAQSEQTAASQRLLFKLSISWSGMEMERDSTHFAKHERTLCTVVPSDSSTSSHPLSKYWHRVEESKLHFTLLFQILCPFELLIMLCVGVCVCVWTGSWGVLVDNVPSSHLFTQSTYGTGHELATVFQLKALSCCKQAVPVGAERKYN